MCCFLCRCKRCAVVEKSKVSILIGSVRMLIHNYLAKYSNGELKMTDLSTILHQLGFLPSETDTGKVFPRSLALS